jgi:putative resolvase
MQLVPIGVAAQGLGVHPDTLRRWEKEGKIDPPGRTVGATIWPSSAVLPHTRHPRHAPRFAYARLSTNGQKDDLARQIALLEH